MSQLLCFCSGRLPNVWPPWIESFKERVQTTYFQQYGKTFIFCHPFQWRSASTFSLNTDFRRSASPALSSNLSSCIISSSSAVSFSSQHKRLPALYSSLQSSIVKLPSLSAIKSSPCEVNPSTWTESTVCRSVRVGFLRIDRELPSEVRASSTEVRVTARGNEADNNARTAV
jgi:hypothetical protein